jgi:predicted phosphodiesterase
MRLAVISDTHFGDEQCTLVRVERNGAPAIGPAYESLRARLGRVDYLVLLGDIIDLFLDHIARSRRGERELSFSFAYPNLYLVTRQGESLLLTHGHYLEAYWSIAADWVHQVAGEDLELLRRDELTLREMVGINLPLSQLACTGIGQAHPLTGVARAVQRETNLGRTDRLGRYLDRVEAALHSAVRPGLLAGLVQGFALRWAKRRFLEAVSAVEQTRYSEHFLRSPAVRRRFQKYYRQSMRELLRLAEEHAVELPEPTHVVFGHTHQPIPWGSEELIDVVDGRTVRLCNTGGWLLRDYPDGSSNFPGAELVLYDSERGVWSESIRAEDLGERPVPAAAASVA